MSEKDHMPEASRSRSNSTLSTDTDSIPSSRTQSRARSFASTIKSRTNADTLYQTYSGTYPDDTVPYRTGDTPTEEQNPAGRNAKITEVRTNGQDVDLERGLDAGQNLEKSKTGRSTLVNSKMVTWDGPDDPENPKNWSSTNKWMAVVMVSLFTFVSPVSSSMVAPALDKVAEDLDISSEFVLQLTMSIFILAYAVGPLFLGPLSEVYGRTIVLQLSNLFFLAFNIGCGFAQNTTQMIVFRFFAGLGGSAPLAIGGGVLSDTFLPEQRGKGLAVYSLAPLLGPALGPIAGGFIAENVTWRWVFWSVSILDGVVQIAGLYFLRETYAPRLLGNRAKRLTKETGEAHHTETDLTKVTLSEKLSSSIVRPFRLLTTQPIVQVLAVYMAYIYGLMYLMLSTFPTLWTSEEYYNESSGIGGLNYISIGVGFWGGSQFCAPMIDRIYRILKARNNGVGKPEFRIPLMSIAAILLPTGLFIYGWTAEYRCHWIAPNIGAAIFGMGVIMAFQCIQTYMVDTYTRFAASALAAGAFLRALAGFGFPLFAPYIYASLHYGWGNSVLGFIGIAIGIPAPIFLWKFGEKLRTKSPYAAG
ncbi:MFS multidrug transporter [Penicillium angulare]|uniref:MFS multidrug transporter n=1 Tax=Penicillium angulare TaxID=116970 RepID=UPI002540475D|nr:MFS multidrug transporter [Penicillium angulare]KAJ5261256.1 MFS multidrug transporter [Penicillium angulare]